MFVFAQTLTFVMDITDELYVNLVFSFVRVDVVVDCYFVVSQVICLFSTFLLFFGFLYCSTHLSKLANKNTRPYPAINIY